MTVLPDYQGMKSASHFDRVLIFLALSSATMCWAVTAALGASTTPPSQTIAVASPFDAPSSDKDGKPRGISGMACLGTEQDASRVCSVINDEEKFGQFAILSNKTLTPSSDSVKFIGKNDVGEGVLGRQMPASCPHGLAKKPFGELDGEGVAISDGYFYVSGSHSCSGNGSFKPSSYLLTRFATADGQPNDHVAVERTWRLGEALLDSKVAGAYGKEKTVGTNVEGIAILQGRLFAGLRTPVNDDVATIVSAPVNELFAPGDVALPQADVQTIQVRLGQRDSGIRDIAALSGNRLLILAGPTESQKNVPYELRTVDTLDKDKVNESRFLMTVPQEDAEDEIGKAETVVVLGESPNGIDVMILYDNISEGRPTEYDNVH
ncbi:DUF3616 domain-containing protein [Rhizobium tubonense]|uniref:DUF3616 domain-containing protein n=1 Tax=Rhizobium tubonense TaxID=484088 RepID=A0A2W4C2R6_9HYPH|nr:DUF3616 domain-containing protein [Rhizobium tubonense]PZM07952.1 hypothetical protein CPY51_29775 [Rhizobium tubonense]